MRPKPASIRILAVLLAAIASVSALWALVVGAPAQATLATVGLIGAIALWSANPASRYVVYSAAAVIVGSWLYTVIHTAISGWPYQDTVSTVVSLVPGTLLLLLCFGCCAYVSHYFSDRSRA